MKASTFALFLALGASLGASVHATEVITNSSFDSGSQSWLPLAYTGNIAGPNTPIAAAPGISPLPAPDYSTAGVVRVFGRRWHTEGIYQNILPALPSPPNPAGEPYRFKLRIKVEADVCFVRCILTFVNTTPTPDVFGTPLIVAEKVIRTTTPGQWQWVEVEGVKYITWPTTFTANEAQISVDVGQIYKEKFPGQPADWLPYPSGKWPAYTLDYVSMDLDADLDGLSDSEEAALVPPTFANNPDSDSDGLPDKWEKDHQLLWRVADSSAHADSDGFTNAEEYWAATDPQLTTSYPGKPANANATAAAKAVAKMLALAPSKGKHLIGQTVDNASTEYQSGVVALADRLFLDTGTARWPAMISLTIEGVATPLKISNIMPLAKSYTASGHLVVLKWAMWNPWTVANSNSQGVEGQVDIPALVDPTSPNYNVQANVTARGVFQGWLDAVALEMEHFIDPDPAFGGHPDNVIIFRPMSEMTGDWNWFGHRTAEEYTALWHYIYTDFTARGLNHLLWCYESAQSEHHYLLENGGTPATDGITTGGTNARPVPADYYYPGDGEVDIMGHNFYDNDWVLPNDLNAVFRNYPKIYAFPQAGASTNKTSTINYFDNLNYVTRIATAFPRASFFIPWCTFTTNGGFVTTHHAIIDNPHPKELMTDPSMITDTWMSPWQQWARTNFGTLTAPLTGDSDHDGLSDSMEYALGTAPLTSSAGCTTLTRDQSSGNIGLTFIRNPSASDTTFTIEGSSDLLTWQSLATATDNGAWTILAGGSIQQDINGTVTFTDAPTAGGKRFLRLNVFVH